jgi:hypothetical protein
MSPGYRLIGMSVPLEHRATSALVIAQTVRVALSRGLPLHQSFQIWRFL